MATYYVDLENGNDSNNGTTFALRKKTLSSVSASGNDEIRVMASPAATSLGINGTWTNRAITSASISSSSATTPITVTTSAAHGFSTGDTVCISGHTINTNTNGTWKITVTNSTQFTLNTSVGVSTGGATGTVFNITGRTVELASAVTQTIASTGGSGIGGGNRVAYTGVTNVTVTQAAGSKESNLYDQFAINTTFITGKIASRQLPGTLNLSGFQQINLWVMQTAGTLAPAGQLVLRLCSDSAGDTVVNSINIPAFTATNFWYPVTVNLGSALGSNINSVSFAITTDQGAQTFRVANIFASKASSAADSLTLQSLIGKNDGVWYGIQSIDGVRVILDQTSGTIPATAVASQRKYAGTTATVTTWKKETIKLTATQTNASAGTIGNPVTISGGWNLTDMTTQTDETIVDGLFRVLPLSFSAAYQDVSGFSVAKGNNSGGVVINNATGGVYDFNFINGVSGNCIDVTGTTNNCTITCANIELNGGFGLSAISGSAYYNTYGFDRVTGITQDGIRIGELGSRLEQALVIDNCTNGLNIYGVNTNVGTINEIKNCTTSAVTFGSGASYYDNIRIENIGTLTNNGLYAFANAGFGNIYVANGSTSGHTTFTVLKVGNSPVYFRNVDFGESASIWFQRSNLYVNCQAFFEDNAGVDYIYSDNGFIQTDTTTTNSGTGKSWAMKPTSGVRNAGYPLRLKVAQAAVAANNLVTVTAWVRRSNTAITGRLQVAGGQIAGVDTTSVDASAAANTWQQIELTFTPTAAGVVEIEYLAWGGTTHTAWIDDISITQ